MYRNFTSFRKNIVCCKVVNNSVLTCLVNHCKLIKMSVSNSSCEEVKCIFCNIIKENDSKKILYEDDQVVTFSDIKPAAKCHFLIVTKEHIRDVKVLTKEQKPLVEHMIEVAKKLVQEKSDDPSDCRLGFHWPPFHSVSHLHLHAISPTNDMSFFSKLIFRPDSFYFVSVDYVLKMLDEKP